MLAKADPQKNNKKILAKAITGKYLQHLFTKTT